MGYKGAVMLKELELQSAIKKLKKMHDRLEKRANGDRITLSYNHLKIIFDLGYHYRLHDQYYHEPIVYINDRITKNFFSIHCVGSVFSKKARAMNVKDALKATAKNFADYEIFHFWQILQETRRNNFSKISIREIKRAMDSSASEVLKGDECYFTHAFHLYKLLNKLKKSKSVHVEINLTPALKRGFLFKANRRSKDNEHVFKEIERYVSLKCESANDKNPIFEIKKDYLKDLKSAITILEKEAHPC